MPSELIAVMQVIAPCFVAILLFMAYVGVRFK